jgi:hypothetical protein
MDMIKGVEKKLEKMFLVIILVFVFFTMYYYDNQSIFVCIQDNMDRIVDGKWYYIFNGWSIIPYGLLLQGTIGLWSLPVFVLSRFGLISRTAIIARIWYKLFVIIFLVLDTWQLDELAKKIKLSDEKRYWLKLYFFSSLLVIVPVVHVGQMDAVYLLFVIMGINYYLQEEYKKFLLCFMIAIPGKYIPIFVFIPLVLLKEKRYIYIIRDLFVGCFLVLVDRALYSVGYRIEGYLGIDPYSEIVLSPTTSSDIDALFNVKFDAFGTQMSIFVLCFVCLCIYCYVKKSDLKNELAVYISCLSLAILFTVGILTPYWIILIVPFMLLIIFKENDYYNILLPVEAIFTVGYMYIYIIQTAWIFGSENSFDFLLISLIPGYNDNIHGYIKDFLGVRNLEIYDGAFAAVMVACLIAVMLLTYPLKRGNDLNNSKSDMYLKGWYWFRLALAYGWIFLNIWVVALNHVW